MGDARRILIVDDEPNVRLVFRTALESNAYLLSTAEDGDIALRWLRRSPFDLVLLDLQMPAMGGMELLRRLRAEGNGVPVVIVTAHGSIPDAVQAMKLGAVDFLSKPVTPEALRKVVAEVLARHDTRPAPARKAPADPAAGALAEAKRALNAREFGHADTALHEAIEANPNSAEAHYLEGMLHEMRDERDAAYRSYRAALRADPRHEPAKLQLMKSSSERIM